MLNAVAQQVPWLIGGSLDLAPSNKSRPRRRPLPRRPQWSNLDSFSLLTAMAGVAGGNRARVAISQRLRETVRGDTIIAHVADAEFLIAELFSTPDPSVLAERVRGSISTAPYRLTASIGAVSTPLHPLANLPPHDVCQELTHHRHNSHERSA